MVEGGAPPTVIGRERESRGEAVQTPRAESHPAPEATPLRSVEEMLSVPFLLEGLASDSPQVRMWAAYHLVDRWQPEVARFIEHMWRSPVPEIRESAINLIGKHRLHPYAFPLLRLFTSNEHGLRIAAALAVARLQYEPAGKALAAWFEEVVASREPRTHELEAAAESLLLFDRRRFWPQLFGRLERAQGNHSVFATLFRLLCRHAVEPEEYERLARAYARSRGIFHDFHLTHALLELVGRPNVSRYLQSRQSGGYGLSAIYQECLRLLGEGTPDPQSRQLIDALAICRPSAKGVERFLTIAAALIERLMPPTLETARVQAFLKGCQAWLPGWEDAILKVREIEYHLLISLPLVVVLQRAEQECLAKPEEEALRISRIYQSPLLSPDFMRQILTLLATRGYAPERGTLGRSLVSGWLWDEEKDTLWKLFTDQLEDVDYPFEQTIPQPWSYQIPGLMERLVRALSARFGEYLRDGRAQAADYALEVFRHQGSPPLLELMREHIDPLLNHHYTRFLEVMTHLPDPRFLTPLLAHYREGEYDLDRLIRFICDIHRLPYPEPQRRAAARKAAPAPPTTVRLLCPHCDDAFQYACGEIFVNEERIEQRHVPSAQDLWTPERFQCKNCGKALPFEPDEACLNDLYAELLAARIVHPAQRESLGLDQVHTVAFPLLEGKAVNPARFLAREAEALDGSVESEEEAEFLFELGRFYLEIGKWEQAKRPLRKILAGPVRFPKALYYLGVIAFQEKNIYDARVSFSRLIATCSRDEFEKDLDNPVDMAQHYLKLLDKREFKRSHFHLVSS